MSKFLKSIYGMFTSANSTERRRFLNYSDAMHVNNDLGLNVIKGLNVIVKTDLSKVFGIRPATTFLTKKLTTHLINPPDIQFSVSYANNNDQANDPADRQATVQTSVDADLNGRATGYAWCRVTDHVTFDVWGGQNDRETKSREVNAATKWSSGPFNASASLSVNTDDGGPQAAVAADYVRELGDRWTVGGDLIVKTAVTGVDRWWPSAVWCSGALRYDGEGYTLMVAADQAANVSLLYRCRVNDKLTTGVELTADVRDRTTTVTWMNRVTFGNGIEMRGQIETNGLVVGHVSKSFLQNMFSVGVCTAIDYKTAQTSTGLELTVG